MNEYSKELMHWGRGEEAKDHKYLSRELIRGKWRYKYKPDALSGSLGTRKQKDKNEMVWYNKQRLGQIDKSDLYNGLSKESVKNAWDRRRTRMNEERKLIKSDRDANEKKAKEAAKKGYWENVSYSPSNRDTTWGFDQKKNSVKTKYTKGQYIDERQASRDFDRNRIKEQLAKETEDAKAQKKKITDEVHTRMKTIRISDLSKAEKREALKEGRAIIKEMKRGYRKHVLNMLVSKIRLLGFDPLS